MNLDSIQYILFVALLPFGLTAVPARFRWFFLLMGSWYFYLVLQHPSLLLALLSVTLLTYGAGRLVGRWRDDARGKAVFLGGILGNLLLLVGMKYLPFLTQNLNLLFRSVHLWVGVPEVPPLLAIGVSYFVFQAISYLVDVYLGMIEPERHVGIFALYLGFFPKLLQGPIERAEDLLPQLRVPFSFCPENVRAGILLFGWGLFKKTVVADRLAVYVRDAFDNPAYHAGLPLLVATYFYAFQLYYDFSGYTDMALGSARLFNVRLSHNFNRPYLATSVAEFWRRWHMTFSRWILDYIFKPLQFAWRDRRQAGTAAALVVTFLVSGIWHGASWGFVAWGGLHGIYLATSIYYKPHQKKLYRFLGVEKSRWLRVWQIVATFHLVCFAWIFFRAPDLGTAWFIVTHLFVPSTGGSDFLLSHGAVNLAILAGSLLVVWGVSWAGENVAAVRVFFAAPLWLRWSAYGILLTLLLLFTTGGNTGFIYFQF